MTQPETFPPLATLEAMPLHSGRVDFDEPGWFGCEQPERPGDGDTLWDWRCPSCVLHATAVLRNQGDSTLIWYPSPGADPQRVTLSWHIERAAFWASGETT